MISIAAIPNRNRINISNYYAEGNDSQHHHELLIEFCEKTGVPYDPNDVYKSLLEQEFVIIITSEIPIRLIGCYLPNSIVLDQKEYLKNMRNKFKKFDYISILSYFSKTIDISIKPGIDKDLMLDYFYEELDHLSILKK